jgi:superfamily II DNA or RNA helicase
METIRSFNALANKPIDARALLCAFNDAVKLAPDKEGGLIERAMREAVKFRPEPRGYQKEVIEKARAENTIYYLDTGSGKTFLPILLIEELRKQSQGTYLWLTFPPTQGPQKTVCPACR